LFLVVISVCVVCLTALPASFSDFNSSSQVVSAMNKRETQKGSVSIFSPTSIVGALILYFVVPTILLLLFVQFVELPSDFFHSSISSKASYDKVTITSTTPSTHSKSETQSIQNPQRQQQIDPNINVETRSDTSSKTIYTQEKQPLPTTASRSVNGIDAQINNARQVLRVSA
jgi:hypothetical protein